MIRSLLLQTVYCETKHMHFQLPALTSDY